MAQSGRQPPTTCRARSGRPRRTKPEAWSAGSTTPPGAAPADYVSRSIRQAAADKAECLVVRLDTPSGLLDSTKQIVQAFYASTVPVVVYVEPEGASAGSAGCFITLAADVAAMAPHSTIGAAHPVSLGGIDESKPDDVMAKKLESFGASFIESIAAKHH